MKLSNKEEELMGYLWDKGEATLKELIEAYPEPQPANTTIATMLKRLTDKAVISYTQQGKVRIYSPTIKKEEYSSASLSQMIDHFFQGSTSRFASFFTKKMGLTDKQLKELRDIIDDQLADDL